MELATGDWVFVRLQPHCQTTMRLQKTVKLSPKYFGPYQIVERIGAVSYILNLPPGTRLHNVFHVSHLKLKLAASVQPESGLPTIASVQPGSVLPTILLMEGVKHPMPKEILNIRNEKH